MECDNISIFCEYIPVLLSSNLICSTFLRYSNYLDCVISSHSYRASTKLDVSCSNLKLLGSKKGTFVVCKISRICYALPLSNDHSRGCWNVFLTIALKMFTRYSVCSIGDDKSFEETSGLQKNGNPGSLGI